MNQIANEQKDDRFSFGENWLSFLEELDDARVVEAERSLQELLGLERLDGKCVLDIGSGSGLSSLAARRLGARVRSFDYDAQSVQATQAMKDRFFANDENWTIERGSVLDKAFIGGLGTYDIVYSWGVLHHTGAMHDAIANSASCVSPGGLFAFALYRKTALCGMWGLEKRWYANASPVSQEFARSLFIFGLRMAFFLKRRDFSAHVRGYRKKRGMHFVHDVHDWMGGYPYESISPAEVGTLMDRLKLEHVRSNIAPYGLGIFGSGCDEYVYRRDGTCRGAA